MNWDNKVAGCELCEQVGGELIWQNENCAVILVDDPCSSDSRALILAEHAAEMTDLTPEQRSQFDARGVWSSRCSAMCSNRQVNLASLGNMVAHVHWHVIPRYADDACFPNPDVWALTPE